MCEVLLSSLKRTEDCVIDIDVLLVVIVFTVTFSISHSLIVLIVGLER